MNDDDLSQLFRTGTATARDPSFSKDVDLRVQSQRQISALLNGVRLFCVTTLAVGLFVLTQMYQVTFGTAGSGTSTSVISIIMPLVFATACAAFVARRKITS